MRDNLSDDILLEFVLWNNLYLIFDEISQPKIYIRQRYKIPGDEKEYVRTIASAFPTKKDFLENKNNKQQNFSTLPLIYGLYIGNIDFFEMWRDNKRIELDRSFHYRQNYENCYDYTKDKFNILKRKEKYVRNC